jgi:hypothetical protein
MIWQFAQKFLFALLWFWRGQATLAKHAEGSRCEYAKMMDLREAKACLDEYRISLATTCEMLKPNVAEGELGEAIGKLNDSLIAMLNTHVKEALVLYIMIWRQMNARHEQMVDFPDEWADLLVALNQLKLATDRADEAQAEYLRKAAALGTEIANPVVEAIRKFKQTHAHLFTADRTDRAGNVGPEALTPRSENSDHRASAPKIPWRPGAESDGPRSDD